MGVTDAAGKLTRFLFCVCMLVECVCACARERAVPWAPPMQQASWWAPSASQTCYFICVCMFVVLRVHAALWASPMQQASWWAPSASLTCQPCPWTTSACC
eukprot:1161310-Pelagomonas_calceolata.AAC.4